MGFQEWHGRDPYIAEPPVPLWTAGYAGYRYLAGVIRSIEPMIEHYGVATADELDIDTLEERLRTAAAASGSTVAFSAIVSAWTTNPAI